MKKFLALILMVLCVGSFVFAGGEGEKEDKQITLRMNQFQMNRQVGWELMAEKYNELHPNITIEVERAGGDNYWTTLKTVFASGDIHDFMMLKPWAVTEEYAEAGFLLDLTDKFDYWDKIPENFVKNGLTFDGGIYGVPLEYSALGVVYNRDIFEKLGIEVPRTLSEMREVVAILKQNDIIPFSVGYKDAWTLRHLFAQGHTPTVDIIQFVEDMNNGKGTFYNSKMDGVFDLFDLMHENTFEHPFDSTNQNAVSEFAQGNTAMYIQGQWCLIGTYRIDPDFEPGMFGLPVSENPDDAYILSGAGTSLSVYKDSENVDEALAFINWFYSDQVNTWTSIEGHTSSTVVKGAQPAESLKKMAGDITAIIDDGRVAPRGWSIWPNGFDVSVQQAMQQYFIDLDREAFFKTIDKEYADFVKK